MGIFSIQYTTAYNIHGNDQHHIHIIQLNINNNNKLRHIEKYHTQSSNSGVNQHYYTCLLYHYYLNNTIRQGSTSVTIISRNSQTKQTMLQIAHY